MHDAHCFLYKIKTQHPHDIAARIIVSESSITDCERVNKAAMLFNDEGKKLSEVHGEIVSLGLKINSFSHVVILLLLRGHVYSDISKDKVVHLLKREGTKLSRILESKLHESIKLQIMSELTKS